MQQQVMAVLLLENGTIQQKVTFWRHCAGGLWYANVQSLGVQAYSSPHKVCHWFQTRKENAPNRLATDPRVLLMQELFTVSV